MADKHGQYSYNYQFNGVDLSAANRYDDPTTVDPALDGRHKYDEPKLLSHLNFFIYRLSFGKNRDMDARYHTSLVADNGIKPFGWYLAPRIGQANWQYQADKAVQYAEGLRQEFGTPLVPPAGVYIDVERKSLAIGMNHTKWSVTNWLVKYTNRLSQLFGEGALGIYTSQSHWDELTYKTDRFKNLKLFVAQYNDWIPAPSRLPRDWAEHRHRDRKWNLWQWAAEGYKIDGDYSGKHYGVHSAYIDQVRFNGDVHDFKVDFGVLPYQHEGEVPPPEPPNIEPDPDPDPDEYVIGRVTTNGKTLWTHSEPNVLVSTRNGYLPDRLDVLIDEQTNNGSWLKLRDANAWVSAAYITILSE